MAIMVFRRSVYETRRRPKGLLRPKTRANLKDAQNVGYDICYCKLPECADIVFLLY